VSKAPEPEPLPLPEPEPVKNDWAERMAQAAVARMASAKSTLVAGELPREGATASARPAHPFDRAPLAPRPRSELPRPAGFAARAPEPAGRTHLAPPQRSGPLEEGPARPRLSLQSRSSRLPDEQQQQQQQQAAAAEPEWKRSGDAGGRPRLALQPRSKPLDAAAAAAPKAAAIFGAAKPREEILRGRGVEPGSAEGQGPPSRSSHPGPGAGDEWHTVGKGRKGAGGHEPGAPALDDPLLSGSRPVNVAAQRAYGSAAYDGGFHGYGSGSHGSHGSSYGRHFPQGRLAEQLREEEAEETGVFRRALPTRGDLF
jgi:collagen type III alpha